MSRTLIALGFLLPSLACSSDSNGPSGQATCAGNVTVTVSNSTAPSISWTPACRLFFVLVEEAQGDVWRCHFGWDQRDRDSPFNTAWYRQEPPSRLPRSAGCRDTIHRVGVSMGGTWSTGWCSHRSTDVHALNRERADVTQIKDQSVAPRRLNAALISAFRRPSP